MTSRSPVVQLVTRSDTIGGVHTHIISLCQALLSQGQEVIVLAGSSQSSIFFKKLDHLGIPYFIVPFLKPKLSPAYDLKAFISLVNIFQKLRPKYVCIHSSKVGILGRLACFLTKIPCIFTVHGWSYYIQTSLYVRAFYFLLEFFLQFIPQRIILVSYADYLSFKPYFWNIKKVSVIYNSSNLLCTPTAPTYNRSTRFLCVARFDLQKDHNTLLTALSLIPSNLEWEITLVGDGPLLQRMQQLTASLSLTHRVTFLGFIDSPSELYASSDCFILSSNWEGLPITIIEALSAALPVIASDVGGCNELVLNGYNGFLVCPQSPQLLADAMQSIIEDHDLRIKMSRASNNFFRNIFSYDRFVSATLSVYESLDLKSTS